MFTSRTLILFLIALLMGVGAVLVAERWVSSRMSPTASSAPETVPVVVAALQIPFGEKVEAADLKTVNWPKGTQPGGAFSDTNEVIGKVTTQTIYPEEVILQHRVREHLGGSTLSALISPSMRAITVRANDVVGVAGFLLPGNRVDVLASKKKDEFVKTVTILQDLKVLAVDQEASQDKEKPLVVRAVTLEMTPEQAEILVKATEEGSIQLALRNPTDEQIVARAEDKPVAAPVAKAEPIRLASAPRPAGTTVMMIKGVARAKFTCTARECQEAEKLP